MDAVLLYYFLARFVFERNERVTQRVVGANPQGREWYLCSWILELFHHRDYAAAYTQTHR